LLSNVSGFLVREDWRSGGQAGWLVGWLVGWLAGSLSSERPSGARFGCGARLLMIHPHFSFLAAALLRNPRQLPTAAASRWPPSVDGCCHEGDTRLLLANNNARSRKDNGLCNLRALMPPSHFLLYTANELAAPRVLYNGL